MVDILDVRLVGSANKPSFSSLLIPPSPNAHLIAYANPSLSILLLADSHFWLLNVTRIFPVQSP